MPVISTNNAANASINFLNENSGRETEVLSQLASGNRIIVASDDASGLAIGGQLAAQNSIFAQDTTNVAQGTAILQSADGALAQISNVLARMMSLATEAASGQVTDSQRTSDINTEYQSLKVELASIVNGTTYAGQKLLTGSFLSNVNFLVGTQSTDILTISVATLSIAITGSGGLLGAAASVSTAQLALSAINSVSAAVTTIADQRASIGGYEAELQFSGQTIGSDLQQSSASTSVMLDADVASAKAHLSADDVTTQASVAALTQAANLPQELLRLVQS